MKTLYILLLVLIPFKGRSQEFFIGDDRKLISATMKGQKDTLIMSGTAKDGSLYDSYKFNGNKFRSLTFYFNDNDKCIGIRDVMELAYLAELIKDLNKRFIKYNPNNWVDKDYKTKASLFVYEEDVEVTYVPLMEIK